MNFNVLTDDEGDLKERREGESVDGPKYSVDDVVGREAREDGDGDFHEEEAEEGRPSAISKGTEGEEGKHLRPEAMGKGKDNGLGSLFSLALTYPRCSQTGCSRRDCPRRRAPCWSMATNAGRKPNPTEEKALQTVKDRSLWVRAIE